MRYIIDRIFNNTSTFLIESNYNDKYSKRLKYMKVFQKAKRQNIRVEIVRNKLFTEYYQVT